MLPWVVNDRTHPRTSRRPCLRCSNKLCQISFTSLTTCNSFTLNSFADPHPLNSVLSILYKKGGGRAPSRPYRAGRAQSSVFRTLFQVRYPATPLFVTLTKTAGVCTNNSHLVYPERSRRVHPKWVARRVHSACSHPFLLLLLQHSNRRTEDFVGRRSRPGRDLPAFKRFSAHRDSAILKTIWPLTQNQHSSGCAPFS